MSALTVCETRHASSQAHVAQKVIARFEVEYLMLRLVGGNAVADACLFRQAARLSVRRRTESSRRFGHACRMTAPIQIKANGRKPGARERSEYLIDGFRVSFLHQAEWKCACGEFYALGACRHTREAGGMRDAQVRIQRRLGAGVSDFLPYEPGRRTVVLMRERT